LKRDTLKKHPRAYKVINHTRIWEILKELRKNPEVDLTLKLLAIRGYNVLTDFKTSEIARILNVSETSITRWVKIWNEKGIEGLESKKLKMKKERELDRICKERQNREKAENED
jgi:DNA-directed RNA polymerase specialized sigma subunit